jgi:23S rRNA (cytosine1962-C5)-methyltransferase
VRDLISLIGIINNVRGKTPGHSSDTAAKVGKPRLRLRVTAAAERILRGGHPWLYGDSILDQNRTGKSGELAVVYDRNDKFLAAGFFDPDSPIRLRVVHAGKPRTIDGAFWRARLQAAVAARSGLFDENTTGYRLINGESDGWPGLVLDRFAQTLVLKLYASAWLARLKEMTGLIEDVLKPDTLVLRLSRNLHILAAKEYRLNDPQVLAGEKPARPVVFSESGLQFEADVLRGQKTGFFLDQRENRRRIQSLAAGRTVLNAFSYTGGFSLYAARGGAREVASLDISRHALAGVERNFQLNQGLPAVADCKSSTILADAFQWLGASQPERFGLIILDPPSVAKREAERAGAIAAYGKLASNAMRILDRGGVLATCSCSAHVSSEEFFGAVRAAAVSSGRTFAEIETSGHAPDHPARFKEAEYLKAIFLRFEPGA